MKIINYKDLTPELAHAGCFVLDMPNEEYHAYDGISKSGLDLISKSPAHYLAKVKREPSAAMRAGSIIHTAILEPERFARDYLILKGINDKRKSEYKQAIKTRPKEFVLTEQEGANLLTLQEAIAQDDEAAALLAGCDMFEVSAFFGLESGTLLKCRFDALNSQELIAVDIKKTECSRREDFAKSVFNYRYHVQYSFYSHVFELITGKPLNAFKFLAVEANPPHCPMVYELDEAAKQIGYELARDDLEAFTRCMTENTWQGYHKSTEPLSLPNWALAKYEDELGDIE